MKQSGKQEVKCLKYSEKCNLGIAEIPLFELVYKNNKGEIEQWYHGRTITQFLSEYKNYDNSREKLEELKTHLNDERLFIREKFAYSLTHPETGLNVCGSDKTRTALMRILKAFEIEGITLIKDADNEKVVESLSQENMEALRKILSFEDTGTLKDWLKLKGSEK